MKTRLLIGAFLALATPVAAAAADMATKAPASMPAVRPIYDWAGWYLGINAGGGRSDNCWDMNGYNVPIYSPYGKSTLVGVSGISGANEGCSSPTGAIVGGQVGYRYQMSAFVFGIEAQGDWADLNGSFASTALSGVNATLANWRSGGSAALTNTSKVDAIGMFTGQIGYSFGPMLWYVKGGVAVTDNKYSGVANVTFGPTASIGLADGGSAIRFGEVVGTGLEYMFASGWSIAGEYNHLFMGSQQVGLAYTGNTVNIGGLKAVNIVGIPSRNESMSGDIDMATVKLNYRFGAQ